MESPLHWICIPRHLLTPNHLDHITGVDGHQKFTSAIAHHIIPRQNAPVRRVGREAILQITLRTDTNAFSTVQTYEEKPPFRAAHTARNAQQAILSRALVLCVNGVFDGYESKKHRVAKDLELGWQYHKRCGQQVMPNQTALNVIEVQLVVSLLQTLERTSDELGLRGVENVAVQEGRKRRQREFATQCVH